MQTSRPTLNPILRSFWETRSRNKILYGGRASSKSWDCAGHAIRLAVKYKLKFLCVRQVQNKIDQSVYSLLKTQIKRFGYESEFDILRDRIIHKGTGSEFHFYGLWRHIDQVKGFEGADVLWIEEGEGLTENQWEILEPTIRADNSEVWITFNPKIISDFVYTRFVLNPPKNTIVQKINYLDNPFLSDTLLNIINEMKADDDEAYNHIYLGEPKTDDDDAFIKRSWINSAIDAHIKLGFKAEGIKTVGNDIADDGDDTNAIAGRHGSILNHIEEWKGGEDELFESSERVHRHAKSTGSEIIYDCIGVGAGAGSNFKQINDKNKTKVKFHKFRASDGVANPDKLYKASGIDTQVTNKDQFMNIKAQAWQLLADRLKNTHKAIQKGTVFDASEMISISSADIPPEVIEQIKNELSAPHKQYDGNQRVKVESKKDMKKRGVPSPNIADAVVMAYANELIGKRYRSLSEVTG